MEIKLQIDIDINFMNNYDDEVKKDENNISNIILIKKDDILMISC